MNNKTLRAALAAAFIFIAGQVMAHLCDNVFRQADKLIVKPETYNIVVKDKAVFKIFLQNNMDRGIADISLIPDSPAFDFSVTPQKMAIPKDQRTFFEVTLTPKPEVKTGSYTINFRLVGGKDQRLFKSFSLKMEDAPPDPKPAAVAAKPGKKGQPETPPPAAQPADAAQLPAPHALVAAVRPTETRPEIDGLLTDASWKKAAVLSNFATGSGDQAIYDTTALVTFDAARLYLYILCNDENAEMLAESDSVEVLIAPLRPRTPTYSIKVTAMNTPTLQAILPDGTAAQWPVSGLSFAVDKTKRAWALEIAIPLAALEAKAPTKPELWQFRINRNKAGGNPEKSYWSADSAGANSATGMGVIQLQP